MTLCRVFDLFRAVRLSAQEVKELRDLAVKREKLLAFWVRQANNLANTLGEVRVERDELERENERLRLKLAQDGHPSRWKEGE